MTVTLGDFKVNSQLTLNLGLRYELVQFPLEIHDAFANWNFIKHNMDFAGKDIPRRQPAWLPEWPRAGPWSAG